MSNASSQRLARLLALVPYLLARPGILVEEAARDFDVSPKQLRKDLELLWMCGLPGYGPGDLIDLSFDDETVTVSFDAGMNRPLRLTATEATSLLVALRALADTPGVTDTEAVSRAVAKIEDAVGQAQPSGLVIGLGGRPGVARTVQDTVTRAVDEGRALRIRYYTASRDAITSRVVDPKRVLLMDGHSYLDAWCRQAEATRLFRLDRVDEAVLLDEPARTPEEAEPVDVAGGAFRPTPDQETAVLELAQDARWVSEYYPTDERTELPDGRLRVRLRYSDRSWVVRLVLGLGGRARVVEPLPLGAEVAERAERALRLAGELADAR
ncbi:helix-turn-helix transcriptional regulator [Actinoalloteichus spitiensis]|uniref:helix-turn-helix transcriptional regulator n=1 Tax=Actinoalloteichus spitiensis TaxID=252394 RepID=UPI0003634448|nr:YafY family protein [Actinoalloteichus spitiensis]